jgi:ABC-2 type transport system ATP-binding protein
MEYVLTTENLSKKYKHGFALNGLSMHVPKGAVYGVVGRNGAGKTTVIRLISGLQTPTSGEYTIFGRKGTEREIGKSRRRMGVMFETPSVYLYMTAEENLKQQYRVLGIPSFDGITELLTMVGLQDTGKKKVKHFSMGMQKRLSIAIALCGDPDFLVLDEPLNGLDPEGIVQIRELLLKLNREKQVTVFISGHILEELSKIATHYGFLDNGRIVKEISAKELEASCKKCISAEVSDVKVLARILDEKGTEYTVLSENTVEIFDEISITELVHLLEAEGCELYRVREREATLEYYYISLVGGKEYE